MFKKGVISGELAKKLTVVDYRKRSAFVRLPFLYPSWNVIQGMHWVKRKKAHDKFQQDAGLILNGLQIQPFEGPVRIFIDLCFKKTRVRDNDNYGGKWLLDCLVKCGILKDDSTEWIPSAPDIKIISGEPEDHTMIAIEEI